MSNKLTGYVWDGCAAAGMKLSSVAIMARLADWCNEDGVCWPSVETIARQTGAGISTVRAAIAQLEEDGWLTRKHRRKGNRNASNVYQLNVGKLYAAAEPYQKKFDAPESDQSKSGRSHGCDNGAFHPPDSDASESDPSESSKKDSFDPPESGGDPSVNSTTDPSDLKNRAGEISPVDNFLLKHPDAVIFDVERSLWGNADDLAFSKWFYARVLELHERAAEFDGMMSRPPEPNWTVWANEIRLLRDGQGCDHDQMRTMVERIHENQFWCEKVKTAEKLREKWPELVLRLCPVSLADPPRQTVFDDEYYKNDIEAAARAGFRV